jgi:hypothetical protein
LARIGDKLVTTSFRTTATRGLAAVEDPTVAVCLQPGTELAFETDIEWRRPFLGFFQEKRPSGKAARFRRINTERTDRHHDAIEFANGEILPVSWNFAAPC